MTTLKITPDTTPADLTQRLCDTLNDSWNWYTEHSNDALGFVLANSNTELVITESWYADNELDGMSVFYADPIRETEDAIQFEKLLSFDDRNENQAHFQHRKSAAWVPKSVIQARVSTDE